MLRKVLIVDDDRILRRLIAKKCQKYAEVFVPLLAGDGQEALDLLKNHSVSLIVTDLQMPKMDGFALIARLSETYPDIPVVILTAYNAPEWRKKVLKESASGYIEKPFVVEKLVETINDYIAKESEGGLLNTVSLEMFVQLIELDSRTCSLRVLDKASRREGGLFFREGELLDARIGETRGVEAAHEILSWSKVTIFLQDSCAVGTRNIEEDVQAILLEAMRLKDEAENMGA